MNTETHTCGNMIIGHSLVRKTPELIRNHDTAFVNDY